MSSCANAIQEKIDNNQLDTITRLRANTIMPINMTSSNKQLFTMAISRQETIKFTIRLVSNSQPTNVGVTVTIYQLTDDNQVILLGSVLITEMIIEFQKDLTPGNYIICIGSKVYSYTGTFIGIFTGVPITALLKLAMYTGSEMNSVKMYAPIPSKKCNKTIYFTILEGSLPPGLVMTGLGTIYGVLPNMDCCEDNQFLSPSQNWYYSLDDAAWFPWGRQWRFLVKIWIGEFPSAIAIRWLCIRVHNNWSWDRDNFKPPFEYEVDTLEEIVPTTIDLCCEPANEPEPFVPTPLPFLCPCDSESPFEQATTLNFLQWYENNLKNPSNSEYVQEFIDNFKTTETYTKLMIEAGKEDELSTPLERELKAVEKLIKSYLDALDNGRGQNDIDTLMLDTKDQENQKLPITAISLSGSKLTIGELR